MALKLPEIFSRTDAKSRIFLVIATIIGVGGLIYFGSKFLGGGAGLSGQAKIANAPSDLQSVPGGQLTPEYSRALAQENTQATQKAQTSGGSSVATLVNVASDTSQTAPNCTVVCPGADQADVTGDINNLAKLGKLSQGDANNLLDMAKDNVPVSQYAATLDQLVKQGKITPEQARKLLDEYTKQHSNALVAQSAQTMDALIKSGRLPVDVAAQLLASQKDGISSADYSAQLNRLVAQGKISPEVAAQLLAQYTQQKAQEVAKENLSSLQAMAKSGQISPEVAEDLTKLQKRTASVADYQTELNNLVAQGKMTPATAAKLLEQYRAQRTGGGAGSAVNGMVAAQEVQEEAEVNDLVKSGKISAATAAVLVSMQKNHASCSDYQKTLTDLVAQGKMPADVATKLKASCDKTESLRQESAKLLSMQGNNVSPAEYSRELTRAVQLGLITPEQAAKLQQDYLAMTAAVPAGYVPATGTTQGVQSNVPGNSDFAKLQQRLQEQQTAPALVAPGSAVDNSQQFADAAAQAAQQASAAAESARQQKIQELIGAMSGQAHALIAAWAPPVMQHKSGSGSSDSSKGGKEGGGGLSLFKSSTTTKTTGGSAVADAPIIKAGTIYFAILDTGVNSDFPDTPVMATIIAGPYKGAKLLGKVSINTNPTTQTADRVSLTFNLMNIESLPKSQAITAFAVDPQTARTVLASKVDYHYLLRYGSIMGSAFLSGYANAISNAGATTSTGIFGTTTTHPELSAASKLAVGLGQVGTTLGTATANYVNTPPTVRVNAGVGLGILFMSDLTIST
jgi:polyhydroxyalkanoate synthesis regulator phasin